MTRRLFTLVAMLIALNSVVKQTQHGFNFASLESNLNSSWNQVRRKQSGVIQLTLNKKVYIFQRDHGLSNLWIKYLYKWKLHNLNFLKISFKIVVVNPRELLSLERKGERNENGIQNLVYIDDSTC